MKKAILIFVLGLVGCASAVVQAPLTPADQLAEEVAEAMGGHVAMQDTKYLRFDFAVVRNGEEVSRVSHLWDRMAGRYRVEWKNRDGDQVQVCFNVNSRDGRAWKNGEPVESQEEQKNLLERAYGRYINDTYWLLMPWKLRDPGVNLDYLGQMELEGKPYEVLHLSFENVGLTPGDQYWAFINPETKQMERWAYFLQSMEGEASMEAARPWIWQKWEQVGGIRLAREKVSANPDSPAMIHFPVLAAPEAVDDEVFDSPSVPLPPG